VQREHKWQKWQWPISRPRKVTVRMVDSSPGRLRK
jgi:hypothetical protein